MLLVISTDGCIVTIWDIIHAFCFFMEGEQEWPSFLVMNVSPTDLKVSLSLTKVVKIS